LNIFNKVELKEEVNKRLLCGATLFNAPTGNYKAQILVWNSLEGMKPLTQVGEYNFKITK